MLRDSFWFDFKIRGKYQTFWSQTSSGELFETFCNKPPNLLLQSPFSYSININLSCFYRFWNFTQYKSSPQFLSDVNNISVNDICLMRCQQTRKSPKKCFICSKKRLNIDWQSNLLTVLYLLFHVRNEIWHITLLRSVSSITFYGHVQELPWGLVFNVQLGFIQGRAHSFARKPPEGEGIPICPLNCDTSMLQMPSKQVEFLHSIWYQSHCVLI